MPPGVPAVAVGVVAVGVEVEEGPFVGADGDRASDGAEGPAAGCEEAVPVSVGVEAGGAVDPLDGAEVAVDPGAAGDRW